MTTSGASDARHRPVHGDRLTTPYLNTPVAFVTDTYGKFYYSCTSKMPWSPAFGRPLLQLHTSLRPDELAGNMHEDIWYCQRILRLPLPA